MAERVRFHLDEHVDPDIARALRRYGIDVTTTIKAGLRTQRDEAQLAFIRQERRVVVTHGADFLRFASRSVDHPGIAYCHKTARSLGEMIRSLILIYEILDPEDMNGRVEFLQSALDSEPPRIAELAQILGASGEGTTLRAQATVLNEAR